MSNLPPGVTQEMCDTNGVGYRKVQQTAEDVLSDVIATLDIAECELDKVDATAIKDIDLGPLRKLIQRARSIAES